MGLDQVIWDPCLGTTGDLKYNLAGCTQIDGTVDTGEPAKIPMGDASGFSSTPTIAEINASSGINQVIALLKRRAILQNTFINGAFGYINLSYPSYVTDASIYSSRVYGHLFTTYLAPQINALRVSEGLPAYTFPDVADFDRGKRILGSSLAHCRKALGIYGTITKTMTSPGWRKHYQWMADYNTPARKSLVNGFDMAGKLYLRYYYNHRFRVIHKFDIQEYLSSVVSATWAVTPGYYSNTEPCSQVFRSFNSSVTPAVADFSSFDNVLGTFSNNDTTKSMDVKSLLQNRAGGWMCVGGTTDVEYNGPGAGYTNGYFYMANSTLTIDVGS